LRHGVEPLLTTTAAADTVNRMNSGMVETGRMTRERGADKALWYAYWFVFTYAPPALLAGREAPP
jgi:hypothetical protein